SMTAWPSTSCNTTRSGRSNRWLRPASRSWLEGSRCPSRSLSARVKGRPSRRRTAWRLRSIASETAPARYGVDSVIRILSLTELPPPHVRFPLLPPRLVEPDGADDDQPGMHRRRAGGLQQRLGSAREQRLGLGVPALGAEAGAEQAAGVGPPPVAL